MQPPSPTQTAAPSVPPPSYPPASVIPPQPPPAATTGAYAAVSPDRSSAQYQGWRPADDDDSPVAVAWRARTGLRRADRALNALGTLNENVEKLNATIEAWGRTWDRHWKTVSRIAWAVGIPLLVAAVLGAGAWVWRWVSTLHH